MSQMLTSYVMDLISTVRGKLAELGETPDEMAIKLGELKIKGVVGEDTACPLFHYLRPHIPHEVELSICGNCIEVHDMRKRPKKIETELVKLELKKEADFERLRDDGRDIMPATILSNHYFDFVDRFDNGLYPELVATDVEDDDFEDDDVDEDDDDFDDEDDDFDDEDDEEEDDL